MGMLLSFRPLKAARPKTGPKPAAGATASIIIFPGIRYERQKPVGKAVKVRAANAERPAPVQY
jgi:hypothetical protein